MKYKEKWKSVLNEWKKNELMNFTFAYFQKLNNLTICLVTLFHSVILYVSLFLFCFERKNSIFVCFECSIENKPSSNSFNLLRKKKKTKNQYKISKHAINLFDSLHFVWLFFYFSSLSSSITILWWLLCQLKRCYQAIYFIFLFSSETKPQIESSKLCVCRIVETVRMRTFTRWIRSNQTIQSYRT